MAQLLTESQGGTGEISYTDGQLLIGDSSTNGLTKATLTATGGAAITNGNGSITISAAGTLIPGNSGGVVFYSSTTTLGSSATLGSQLMVIGGGVGVAPTTFSGSSGGICYFATGGRVAGSATMPANTLVVGGGTGNAPLSFAGTSGGVPFFNSDGSVGSSATLTASEVVLGGGAGTAPATFAGTSGGVAFFGAGGTLGSSTTLTSQQMVIGSGAGVAPTTFGGSSGGICYFASGGRAASSATIPATAVVLGGGTGNAPLASTITTDDGTKVVINENAAAPPAALTGTQLQISQVDATICGLEMRAYGSGNSIDGFRADNTNASPTALVAADTIFRLTARGYQGTNGYSAARALLLFNASENWSNTANGTVGQIQATAKTTLTTSTVATFQPAADGGVQNVGTATGNNQAAGIVGEYLSSIVLIGSEVAVGNATTVNITSKVLTAGDWDVWGEVWYDTTTGSATVTILQAGINTVSATIPAAPGDGVSRTFLPYSPTGASTTIAIPCAPCQVNSSGSTTVYLLARASVSAGTLNAYGKLCARRR